MKFQIAKAAFKTGRLLEELVSEKLGSEGRGMVCYGVGYSGSRPALNANCSLYDKHEQAKTLWEKLGVQALRPLSSEEATQCLVEQINPVVLARKKQHTQGKDIRVCLEPWHVEAAAPVSDFFTPYQSSIAEHRVWVYRKRHLGTYTKSLEHPEEFQRLGRNRENGFVFKRLDFDATPEPLKDLGRAAVAALGLDFGAVDVLESTPGSYIVLEVNSAPGVADERRDVIQRLAHRIVRWEESGCPSAEPQTL